MLLEIGLLKRKKQQQKKTATKKKQQKKKTKPKTKTKQNKTKVKKKYIKIALSLGYPSSYFFKKDVICCSNGYIYHFLDYLTLILEHRGTWTRSGKESLDDNFHQFLLRDSENH